MDLLRNRPLSLWCVGFLLASVGGFFLFRQPLLGGVSDTALLVAALLLVLGGGGVAVLLLRRDRRRAAVALVCALLGAAALGQSFLTFAGVDVRYLQSLEGQTIPVEAVVLERRGGGGYLTGYAVELTAADGQPLRERAVLTCHYPAGLSPGDRVVLDATVTSLADAAGNAYDATALLGDGYSVGLVSEDETATAVTERHVPLWQITAGELRRTLAARLNLLTENAAGLPSALLLGDKSALDTSVRRDFARAGVSHLLAISGLHMTLLFGLLESILRLLRLPKRVRAILLAVAAAGYLCLLGFPASATRAVIMLGMVYLSHLLSARADSLTSLSLAGALIVLVSPHAVADAGFWMSFMATLGLVTLTPPLYAWATKKRRGTARNRLFGRVILLSQKGLLGLAVGLVAMSFTLFLVAAVIGEMGLLSPLSTLLLTPLCGAVLLISPAALLCFGTPVGDGLGWLIERICSLMTAIAEGIASPSWVVVSLMHPAVLPLAVIMTAALLVLLTVRLPAGRRWVVILPILVGWLGVGGMLVADDLLHEGEVKATYLQPSSQSDALVLVEGHEAVICDLSNGSLTALSAASAEASRRGATEIAVLLLTHYHTRTSGTLVDFLAAETVRALWLPVPTDTEEYALLTVYADHAAAAGVPVTLYEPGGTDARGGADDPGGVLTVFGTATLTLQTTAIDRSVQPVLLLSLDTRPGEVDAGLTVYCGSAVFESDLADTAAALVSGADTVIFGNHGPLPKAAFGKDLSFREDAAVILSREGKVAGYFNPSALPEGSTVWWGQKRFWAS